MKIRIKFQKLGAMKFIGHLDIMRFFQKAVRRSGIDICYTEGFSPHMMMSFAAPLGVGVTSGGEYLDIEVHTSASSQKAIDGLNAVMPQGIKVTGYVQLDDKAKPAMACVSAADYEIWFKQEYEIPECMQNYTELQSKLQEFFVKPDQILVTKKTKKSEKVLDLKKLVFDFQVLQPEKTLEPQFHARPSFYLNVSTGSTDNLKPELVLETFWKYMGLEFNPYAIQAHRKDVYFTDTDGTRRPLLAAGTEIK